MKKDKKRPIREYAKAIIIALLLALVIRTYIVQAFKIPSGSMIPTLLIGDHILVNKFIYGTKIPFSDRRFLVFEKPERGDIVVFRYPEAPKRDFIKRVIATEDDILESKNRTVYVNGEVLIEPYVYYTDSAIRCERNNPRDNFGPLIVPKGKVFVMGDNRDQSYDSRHWGFVDTKDIRGEALIIYWSWDAKKNWLRFDRVGRSIQ